MISEMAQCGPWMLVPAGLGVVGGLLMGLAGWASVKGKSSKVVGGMILAGGVCIFLSFMIPAYSAIKKCDELRGVTLYWLFISAGIITLLFVVFYRMCGAVKVLRVSLATAIFVLGLIIGFIVCLLVTKCW